MRTPRFLKRFLLIVIFAVLLIVTIMPVEDSKNLFRYLKFRPGAFLSRSHKGDVTTMNSTGESPEERSSTTVSTPSSDSSSITSNSNTPRPSVTYNVTELSSELIPYATSRFRMDTPKGATKKVFQRILKEELPARDKEIFMDLLKVFIQTAEKHNWTYFMESGMLLGSVRHWGFIPWDDDIDITVRRADKDDILRVFKTMEPKYAIYDRTYAALKYFSHKSHLCIREGCKWKWPFIDVILHYEDKDMMWMSDRRWGHKKSNLFPLHLRPFEGLMVKAPKCSLAWLRTIFGYGSHDYCKSRGYSHSREAGVGSPVSIRCELLKDVYPFVFRRWVNGRMEETLKLGNRTLGVRFVDELEWTATKPYSYMPIGGVFKSRR